MSNVLVLVRHGQSEWNKQNLFTGWKDVGLTQQGMDEAVKGGQALKNEGMKFDLAFTSALKRAQNTLDLILKEIDQSDLPIERDQALNERDYGDLVGLNKDDARKKWGDEQVHIWRRSYDIRPPGGESLEDTAARVIPYYEEHILPELKAGKNVIISAHGNSLRALIMLLENLSREEVLGLNLGTGVPMIYEFSADGAFSDRRDLAA